MMHSPATTPRTPRRVLPRSTNTTPARYQTSIAHAPLPSLSSKPYPTQSYVTVIELDFAPMRDNDIAAMEYAVQKMGEKASERKKALAEAQAEVEEEKRRIEEATKALGDVARDMLKVMQKEREELVEAKEIEVEVLKAGRALKIQSEAVGADLAELRSKLAARRVLKGTLKQSFNKQTSKNKPEVEFFEEKLGLKIQGLSRDMIQFKFVDIDKANYTRSFAIDLDISKPSYSVVSISPSSFLPPSIVLPFLIELNTSRDLSSFLQEVRNLFKDEVKLETKRLQGNIEPEGMRERKLLKEARIGLKI